MGGRKRGPSTTENLQRWLLLLGALATLAIFAPRGLAGLILGLGVIALLGARLPQRLLARLGHVKATAPLQPHRSEGGSEEEGPLNSSDWGPALVLVFEARDPVTGENQLHIKGVEQKNSWTLEPLCLQDDDSQRGCINKDVLQRLRDAGLEYRLGPSRGGEYIFCMVRLPELTAQANLSFYHVDLELEPERSRQKAAELLMPLALSLERRAQVDPNAQACEEGLPPMVWDDLHVRYVATLDRHLFCHVPLVPCVRTRWKSRSRAWSACSSRLSSFSQAAGSDSDSSISTSGKLLQNLDDPSLTILPASERLRLLLHLVADDLPGALGDRGPGLLLDYWRQPKLCNCLLRTSRNLGMYQRYAERGQNFLHQMRAVPKSFLLYFLLQDPRDEAFLKLRLKFGHPASPYFRRGLFHGVVDKRLPGLLQTYFGHQIGFYFAFMQHLFSYGFALSVLLAPLLAVYSVDYGRHLVEAMNEADRLRPLRLVDGLASEITSSEAARSHWPLWSLLVGLSTTVWGQCVIESWHRQEQRLAKSWGSSRVDAGRTQRPGFRGKHVLSPVDGRLMQVHYSKRWYQVRVILVNLAFLLLWVLAFTAIGFCFARHLQVRVATEDYASLGVMFSVVSVLLYHLFRVVAHLLTEAENHREEEAWEASILVKKWALTVIVQLFATMHLLFIRPTLWPCAYGEPEVRHRLGIEECAFWDQDCCDVDLMNGDQVILSFAKVRGDAVVRHTRQFIAGWLVSKIFAHNLLKWIVPRLFGFLCTRGLYPLLPVDFAEDLWTNLTAESNVGLHRVGRTRCRSCFSRCCPRRGLWMYRRWARSQTELAAESVTSDSALPEVVATACERQLDKQDPWDVLDTANDLSVHFLVTSLTTVIYPFAPLLFLAQLLVEFQMDLFQLFDRRQPKPKAATGLPKAWLAIFQSYVYVGALSNLAIVTWRTSLVENMLGDGDGIHIAFFSTSMLLMAFVVGIVQWVVPRVPSDVKEHLQREREVEAFFIGHSEETPQRSRLSPQEAAEEAFS